MNRRTLLASVALGAAPAAGSLGYVGWRRSEVPTPDVALEADPLPSGVDASVELTVEQPFTATYPARLAVAFQHEGAEPRRYGFGPRPPFMGLTSEPHGRLVLLSDGSTPGVTDVDDVEEDEPPSALDVDADYNPAVPPEPVEGCWAVTGDPWTTLPLVSVELEPGERLERSYTLLNTADGLQCLPPGEHRFEVEDYVQSGEPWGFTVELD